MSTTNEKLLSIRARLLANQKGVRVNGEFLSAPPK